MRYWSFGTFRRGCALRRVKQGEGLQLFAFQSIAPTICLHFDRIGPRHPGMTHGTRARHNLFPLPCRLTEVGDTFARSRVVEEAVGRRMGRKTRLPTC